MTTKKWGDLSLADMWRIANLYTSQDRNGFQQAAALLETSPQTLARQIRGFLFYARQFSSEPERPKPRPYTDIVTPDPTTDQQQWISRLRDLTPERFISVMHLCDVHFPFHDARALDVTLQITRRVQPSVIVVGSDTADFAGLSSFAADPDVSDYEDVLNVFESFWTPYIVSVKHAAPDAALVFILGNHEARLWRYLHRNAPGLRHTVVNRFIDIVRCGGKVYWLGEVDKVRIGNLTVMHGNRANQHAAKSILEDAGYQVNVMFGHVHRLTSAAKIGAHYQVQAISSGCLRQTPAHYNRFVSPTHVEQQGTCIADVALLGHEVQFNNLLYNKQPDYTDVRFERDIIASSA